MASIQNIIQNWLPTYIIQSGIADKASGAQLVTLFYVCLTAFRFIFGFLGFTDSLKLVLSNYGQFLSGLVVVLLVLFKYASLSAYISSILYGITLSMIFPLILSIPHEFGLHFTDSQISNIMIWVTLEMGLSAITGVLMKIDLKSYQYSLLGWSVMLFGLLVLVMKVLRDEE